MIMAKLKHARGTVLEFRVNWVKHELNHLKMRNLFFKRYFQD
jgi:hypothetical protein